MVLVMFTPEELTQEAVAARWQSVESGLRGLGLGALYGRLAKSLGIAGAGGGPANGYHQVRVSSATTPMPPMKSRRTFFISRNRGVLKFILGEKVYFPHCCFMLRLLCK